YVCLGILFGATVLYTPSMHADIQRERNITLVLTILTGNFITSQFLGYEIESLIESIEDTIDFIATNLKHASKDIKNLYKGLISLKGKLNLLLDGDYSQISQISTTANNLKKYTPALKKFYPAAQPPSAQQQQALQALSQKIATSHNNVPVSPSYAKNQAENRLQ
ncbi:hypothetical protein EBR77_03275, partial [bacterium]|nr:hypothetical protein [bacterium]